MDVEVSTTSYTFAHGRTPRGQGGWAFRGVRRTQTGSAFGEYVFFQGTFTQARRQAVRWAREHGYSRIEVGS